MPRRRSFFDCFWFKKVEEIADAHPESPSHESPGPCTWLGLAVPCGLRVRRGWGSRCLVGFVGGCDEGTPTPAKLDPTANKAREDAESKARQSAYGTTGA